MKRFSSRVTAIVMSVLMVITALPLSSFAVAASEINWVSFASTDFTQQATWGANQSMPNVSSGTNYSIGSGFTAVNSGDTVLDWSMATWGSSRPNYSSSDGIWSSDGFTFLQSYENNPRNTPITGLKNFKIELEFDATAVSSSINSDASLIKIWNNDYDTPNQNNENVGNVFRQALNGYVYAGDTGIASTSCDFKNRTPVLKKYVLEYTTDRKGKHHLLSRVYSSESDYINLYNGDYTLDTSNITNISLGDPDNSYIKNLKLKSIVFYERQAGDNEDITDVKTDSAHYIAVVGSAPNKNGAKRYDGNNAYMRVNLVRDSDGTAGMWLYKAPVIYDDETLTDVNIEVFVDQASDYKNNFNVVFYIVPKSTVDSYLGGSGFSTTGYFTRSLTKSQTDFNNFKKDLGLNSSNYIGSFDRNSSASTVTANSPYQIRSEVLTSKFSEYAASSTQYVIIGFIETECNGGSGKWSDTWVKGIHVNYSVTKPRDQETDENGVVVGGQYVVDSQPFQAGLPSQKYRIPSLVSLNDGTLVAAADARWNGGMDGGGNDVVVARSLNNGNNWGVDLVNYYGDNGNVFNKASTSFCDSALATDGNELWMVSTFFASGRAINVSSANNRPDKVASFDSQGRLLLQKSGESGYQWYLDTEAKINGRYTIRKASDGSYAKNGNDFYTVDSDFYLWDGDNRNGTAVFYSNCTFQAPKTQYLWLRHSSNGGKNWDAPRLLNLRKSNEEFFGIGPGRGIYTSDGRIVFTGYTYDSSGGGASSQRAYLFWSDNDGKTWKRSTNPATTAVWNSESQPVELPNGNIRVFFRNGRNHICYADASFNANGADVTWDAYIDTNIANSSNCQLSAIMYPYKIDGKDVILVSCPTQTENSGSRKSGVLFTCPIQSSDGYAVRDYTVYQHPMVTTGVQYEYSCMTALKDGTVAILYETTGFDLKFRILKPEDIAHGLSVSIPQTVEVSLAIGETVNFPGCSASPTNYDSDIVLAQTETNYTTHIIQGKGSTNYNNDNHFFTTSNHARELADKALWTLDAIGDSNDHNYIIRSAVDKNIYVQVTEEKYPCKSKSATINLVANPSDSSEIALRQKAKGDESNYRYLPFARGGQWGQKYFDYFTRGVNTDVSNVFNESYPWYSTRLGDGIRANFFRKAKPGESYSSLIPGYVKVNINEIVSGERYLIAYLSTANPSNTYFLLYPSIFMGSKDLENNRCDQVAMVEGDTVLKDYTVSFTGNKPGTTTATIGSTQYVINVTNVATVTGAVRYDPIIYTMGSSFTNFGVNISDGSETGENKTTYIVADGWYIDNIKVSTGAISANIVPTQHTGKGKLKGTIDTGYNNSLTQLKEVTLKTTLIGPDGAKYLQVDKLWVETNPVPSSSIGLSYANANGNGKGVNAGALISDAYSHSTYEPIWNTSEYAYATDDDGASGRCNVPTYENANFVNMYTSDGAISSNENGNSADLYDTTADKLGGWFAYGKKNYTTTAFFTQGQCMLYTSSPRAQYYYDKSTCFNPSMSKSRTSSGNVFYLDVIYNRALYRESANQIRNAADDISILSGHGITNYSSNSYGNSINTTPVVAFDYDENIWNERNPRNYQKITIQGTASSDNTVVKGDCIVHTRRYLNDCHVANRVKLQFDVNVIDKSTARTRYTEALRGNKSSKTDNYALTSSELNVLISTDYTTSTWAEYQPKMVELGSYLCNYRDTTDTVSYSLRTAYNNLQKRVRFEELEQELENKADLYQNVMPPISESGIQSYDYSSWNTFVTAYNTGDLLANTEYQDPVLRADTAGFQKGIYNTNREALQIQIDELTETLRNYPMAPADPSAFIAARDLYETIDFDSYVREEQQARPDINEGNGEIFYKDPSTNIEYVKKNYTQQNEVDAYTMAVLTKINSSVQDTSHAKKFTVAININGTQYLVPTQFAYGTAMQFTLTSQLASYDDVVYSVTYGTAPTVVNAKIKRPENDVLTFLLCSDVTVNITAKSSTAVKVYDYFGNLIASGYDSELSGKYLTVDGVQVNPRNNPALVFVGWDRTEEDGSVIYRQMGRRNVINGKEAYSVTFADNDGVFTPDAAQDPEAEPNTVVGLNMSYTIGRATAPAVWTVTVDGKEYLASYKQTFTRFSSNYDVIYKAYDDVSALSPALQTAYGKPITYGDGYISGDNKNKFTLSCFYSQAPGTTIVEAGALYTEDPSKINYDDMIKGGTNVRTLKQSQVGTKEDATYTMTKKDIDQIEHCAMRSYVAYHKDVTIGGTTTDVAFVVYGPIYDCQNGIIGIVEQ